MASGCQQDPDEERPEDRLESGGDGVELAPSRRARQELALTRLHRLVRAPELGEAQAAPAELGQQPGEEGLVHLRQRQCQGSPSGLGAHCSEIAQINRQCLVTDIEGTGVGRKVAACHQRIHGDRQRAVAGRRQQRGVVADTQQHVVATASWPVKEAFDNVEF